MQLGSLEGREDPGQLLRGKLVIANQGGGAQPQELSHGQGWQPGVHESSNGLI